MPELKRNIKGSVFTALFGDPENAVQLYRSLHPEDTQVSAAVIPRPDLPGAEYPGTVSGGQAEGGH